MSESRSGSGRRTFLKGLLTGAGVAADVERYYRTLYT
jgi:hypothetical protein